MSFGTHLSDDDHAKIAKCIREGLTAIQTAIAVDRSEGACRASARFMGMTFKPNYTRRHDNDFGGGNRLSDAHEMLDYRERDARHVAAVLRVSRDYGFAPYTTPPVKIEVRL